MVRGHRVKDVEPRLARTSNAERSIEGVAACLREIDRTQDLLNRCHIDTSSSSPGDLTSRFIGASSDRSPLPVAVSPQRLRVIPPAARLQRCEPTVRIVQHARLRHRPTEERGVRRARLAAAGPSRSSVGRSIGRSNLVWLARMVQPVREAPTQRLQEGRELSQSFARGVPEHTRPSPGTRHPR